MCVCTHGSGYIQMPSLETRPRKYGSNKSFQCPSGLEHTEGTANHVQGKSRCWEPRRYQIWYQNQACHPTLEPNTLASSHFHINHIPSKTSQFDFLMLPDFSALQQSCQWFNQNVVLIGNEGKLGSAAFASPAVRRGSLFLSLGDLTNAGLKADQSREPTLVLRTVSFGPVGASLQPAI